MRSVTLYMGTGASMSWTVDSDCVLRAFNGTGAAVMSSDPQLTYSSYSTPSADSIVEALLIDAQFSPMEFKLQKGTKLYFSAFAAGQTMWLWLDDILPDQT